MKLFGKKGEHKSKESVVKGNSLGASGFTLGVLGVISLGYFGVIVSIVGFIFCFIQQKNKSTKLAKAGLIINVIGIILSILWIVYFAPILANYLENGTFPTA
jgi:hypothetical protein